MYSYNIETKETSLAINDNMGELILLYLATKKTEGLANASIKQYGGILGRFSRHIRKNVQDITAIDIRVYISSRVNQGLKSTTIVTDTDVLKCFFAWLREEEYIDKNPAKKVKSMKTSKRLRKSLTKQEFEVLRTGAKTLRQKAILETFYSTGCRLEELALMKKQDIDWQRLQINVIGKGDKERTVYINATCEVHLRRYLMSRLDECDSVFVTERKPIRCMSGRTIQDETDKIKKQSGLNVNVYPHLIRHTFATHMINNGMSLTTLQMILGHSDPSTTLIYGELNKTTVEGEYRRYS